MKTLCSPDAIICTDLALDEGAGRHFRQSAAQHRRILALQKAIGPSREDGSDDTRTSSMDTAGSPEDTASNAEDADESKWRREHRQLTA